MKRSYLAQQFQNYFDIKDIRVRKQQNTLDALVLNAVAGPLEEHQLRLAREIEGRSLFRCPMNLDNLGVYYRVQIPPSFALNTDASGALLPPASVIGISNGVASALLPFTDLLPVPNGITLDPARAPAPCADPQLASLTFDGSYGPWTLPIPNRLSFFLNGAGELSPFINVIVTGYRYPTLPWATSLALSNESLTLRAEGFSVSLGTWGWIQSLQIIGLPAGAVLNVYAIAMTLPYILDSRRTYQRWDDRDTLYSRYWYLDGPTLNESYYQGLDYGFVDLTTGQFPPRITSSLTPGAWSDAAIEPHTYGMLGLGNGSPPLLYYFDRREDLPGSLDSSALTVEPRYGLDVVLDPLQKVFRRVTLFTQAYAGAPDTASYRFLVEFPNGKLFIYYYDPKTSWTLSPYQDHFWTPGLPPEQLGFSLQSPGTYVFTLETTDGTTVTLDNCPFNNLQLQPAVILPLPGLTAAIGVGFDYKQQLWIWDGQALQPYIFNYLGYVFDPDSRSLYLTQNFDSIQLS
jgi:hypothetical protein